MEHCILCRSYDHSIETGHTQEEVLAWVKRKKAQAAARKGWELRNAYKLVAEDINKSPRNIIKLVNAVKG